MVTNVEIRVVYEVIRWDSQQIRESLTIHEMARMCGLNVYTVITCIQMLEAHGLIDYYPGNYRAFDLTDRGL